MKQKEIENDNPPTSSSNENSDNYDYYYQESDKESDNFQTYDSFIVNDTEMDKTYKHGTYMKIKPMSLKNNCVNLSKFYFK